MTYREADLLYQKGVSSLKNRNRIAEIISHELAHQWFGNLVTMNWWNDLWLNEGFATYMSYTGQQLVDPESRPQDRFVLENNQYAFELDSTEASHPVRPEDEDVVNPVDIGLMFDPISYQKGAALIRMLTYLIGEDTFVRGVSNYLAANAYDNAMQDDLWEKLTEAAHEDGSLPPEITVKRIMDTWTTQKGYPVVTVSQGGATDTTVTLAQDRFLMGKPDSSRTYGWWVPVSLVRVGGDFTDFTNIAFIAPNERNVSVSVSPGESPLIVNVLEANYYRVNYDDAHWIALADAVKADADSVHKINRAQLIDDALNLAKAGYLDYGTALGMTEYLDGENEFVPWSSAKTAFSYINLMLLGYKDVKSLVEGFLFSKVVHVYNALGTESDRDDSYFDVLLRELSVGYVCGFGYTPCVQVAAAQFGLWMAAEDPDSAAANPIDESLRAIFYCTAVKIGASKVSYIMVLSSHFSPVPYFSPFYEIFFINKRGRRSKTNGMRLLC